MNSKNTELNKYECFYNILLDEEIPKAYLIYKESRSAYLSGDEKRAIQLKRLNHILNSSEIPYTCEIGKNSIFAYGGIGVIIHADAKIGERANIGSNVTIGGSQNGVPIIGDDVYLSTGCKVIGKVKIGNGAVIGANAVVLRDVGSFEVFAGIPANKIGQVNRENFDKYSGLYWCKNDLEGINRFLNWYFPVM